MLLLTAFALLAGRSGAVVGERQSTFECHNRPSNVHTIYYIPYIHRKILTLYIYIYLCTHIECVQIHIFLYVCVYVCMYVCMYACMHACMHACMDVRNVRTYVCTYERMNVFLNIYIYIIYELWNHETSGVTGMSN